MYIAHIILFFLPWSRPFCILHFAVANIDGSQWLTKPHFFLLQKQGMVLFPFRHSLTSQSSKNLPKGSFIHALDALRMTLIAS